MKVLIDDTLKGKDLFNALLANKSQLIAQKKALPKFTEAVCVTPDLFHVKEQQAVKTAIGYVAPDATSVRVKLVANTALFMDSQKDVLLPDCWAKSIKDGKGRLHLKDHNYSIDAQVGDVVNIYSQEVSLTELGINQAGTTQSLIYESDVQKSYDEKTFNKYKSGNIRQHSIGLQYVKIDLAINDSDYKEEFANWNKYIDQIINKEDAQAAGYFWIVPEIKLIEVSAVLMGANELTPTLTVGSGKSGMEAENTEEAAPDENTKEVVTEDAENIPLEEINPQHKNIDAAHTEVSTQEEPPVGTPVEPPLPAFDLSHAIKSTQFKF